MATTTQQVLTELATTPMPSAAIAGSFNIAGQESNSFLKDWCMFVNGLYLINREYYRNLPLEWWQPKPAPYSTSSPEHDVTKYTVKIDLEMDDFGVATNYQRNKEQPFNGYTNTFFNMNDYSGFFGANFDKCNWLLFNFETVSPMQFLLDSSRVIANIKEDGEDFKIDYSNKTTAMIATIQASVEVGTPQVPQYDDIVVL